MIDLFPRAADRAPHGNKMGGDVLGILPGGLLCEMPGGGSGGSVSALMLFLQKAGGAGGGPVSMKGL